MPSIVLTVTKTGAAVDLGALGADNWVAWLGGSVTPSQSKASGSGLISAALYSGGSANLYTNDPRTISWSGGAPTSSGSSTAGTYNGAFALGAGFEVTFDASSTTRTVLFYPGYYDADVKITAYLSDGSAGPASDSTTLTGAANTAFDGVVQVVYNSAGSGTMTIRGEVLAAKGGGVPNVTLQAAAVIVGGASTFKAQYARLVNQGLH